MGAMRLWVPLVKVGFKQVELGGKKRSSKPAKPPAPDFRRWLVPAAVTALMVGILGYVWHSLGTPGYGDIATLSPETTNQSRLPEYTTLTTAIYSLNYSERYDQDPTDVPPAGIIDYKSLSYKLGGQPGRSQIQIIVKAAPYGGIVLDSTYDYYAKHLDKYKLSNKYYHGEAIDIARSKSGAPEAAGLWLHDSYLMVVKITTADKDQDIDTELKDILSSVQWRQG